MPSLRCDCDYLAEAESEAELVDTARAHAHDVHQIELDAVQILAALVRQGERATKE